MRYTGTTRMSFGRVCLLALGVATLACQNRNGPLPDARDSGPGASTGLSPELAAQTLARVGDRAITVGEYVAALEHMDQFDRIRYQAPDRRQELLGEMIDVMLLADYAREKGYDKDPFTQQEMREILRDALLKRAHEGIAPPSEVPEVDVRSYYDAHRTDFRDPERRRVSAIILTNEAAANAALESAKKASPASWGELVRTRSADAHAKADVPADLAGDLGFVSPPGDSRGANARVPEEVRAGAFEISGVGDVLPHVVKAAGRYYVVKLAAKTAPHERSFEDAERAIRVKLTQDNIQRKEQALVDDLRRKYPVEIDEGALGQVRADLPRLDGGR
jgi:peptidyl-prolyl cis-trans isomerase C